MKGGLLPKDSGAEVKASTILPLRSEHNPTWLTVTYSTLQRQRVCHTHQVVGHQGVRSSRGRTKSLC